MTLDEIIAACEDRIANGPGRNVVFTLPREARGYKIRFTPTHGPLGEVLNSRNGETTALFDARALLRFAKKVKAGAYD